jgi:hypothetical protein
MCSIVLGLGKGPTQESAEIAVEGVAGQAVSA